MLKDTIDAYAKRDADLALVVWNRDKDLDEMYSSFFRELLTYMMEDPRRVSASVQTLIMARDIERIGDRNTNIVEMVRFLIGGRPVEEERPKADRTKTSWSVTHRTPVMRLMDRLEDVMPTFVMLSRLAPGALESPKSLEQFHDMAGSGRVCVLNLQNI